MAVPLTPAEVEEGRMAIAEMAREDPEGLGKLIAELPHETQRLIADYLVFGKPFNEAIAGVEHLVKRRGAR